MDSLPLFRNYKERKYFFLFIIFLFCINTFLSYLDFKEFKKDEIFKTDAIILNTYDKKRYNVLKLQTINSPLDFVFFTSSSKEHTFQKLQNINLFIVTKEVDFFDYIKGFYGNSFNLSLVNTEKTTKADINNFIYSQHQDTDIASLYSALFLAIPISQNIRELCSNFGISHLVAISGFHLGVMSAVLYFLLHIIYKPIHQTYFPYRNKRFDILLLVTIVLFTYLVFVDLVPSLLRAFVMFLLGLFFLRNNIKILSFETLLIVVVIIIALFPKLLFSLSLWFSVAGVFYIFLFLHYFKSMNKYLQFFLFNFWIYFAINPIVHYFFGVTTLEQLYSPILTVLFTIFYPLVALLHLFEFGGLFDRLISYAIEYKIVGVEVFTPLWFFVLYLATSFIAIFSKKGFIFLHLLFISFGLYIFI